MSGKTANIVIAQEFIYPTSYGEPTLTASTGDSGGTGGGGSSSVALASGVPEDFETRNLGVELTVTPTVEPNDKINLSLVPRVTEFEGYVSYGGPNIAVTGETTIQSPSGYFQPIFSTRMVETEVTVFDGATVVLGGLTREEVKQYKEKIPILGDIPFIGRLFRSEGETSQKLNLIIFVTANLISPGGSPANQSFQGTESNSLFQNPSLISPGGILSRDKASSAVEE
jgi:general secretion pathway protein D